MDLGPIRPCSVLNRPALCPNHRFLAVIEPSHELTIFSLRLGHPVLKVQFPKNVKAFLPSVSIIRWSPDFLVSDEPPQAQNEILTTWILLAGGSRLIAIEVNIPQHSTGIVLKADLIIDYQFEIQYGKIIVADFVLDHSQALVTFDMNTHASLVSLAKPQREDIPFPKFSTTQGLAQSQQQRHFALLLRNKGRDQIAVLTSRDGTIQQPQLFFPDTSDAQGLQWSPDGSPVLSVWDSAAYGAKLSLFTALGHALPSLSMRPESPPLSSSPQNMVGAGVTCFQWTTSQVYGTMLAAGVGGPQLVLHGYNVASLNTPHAAFLPCDKVINGSECAVWQQGEDKSFERVSAVFEVQVEHSSEINMVALSSQADFVAAKVDTMSKSVWLWHSTEHDNKCMLTFQNDVRQILWHPTIPNILGVMTQERQPSVYILYNFEHEPAQVLLPFEDIVPSSRWEMVWVKDVDTERCPLLLSSNSQFVVGFLSLSKDCVVFESLLDHNIDDNMSEAEETEVIDTPSKPARQRTASVGLKMNHMDRSWAAPVTQYVW